MESVTEALANLSPGAHEVIRTITAPVAEDDSIWAAKEKPDLTQLPSALINIQISLPPNQELPTSSDTAQHASAKLNLPTIIFLHGLGCDSTLWLPLIRSSKVRDHFRVVTFDMPGCGRSPFGTFIGVTSDGVPDERLANDDKIFREVMDYISMGGDTHIVAHSLGCRTVERYLISEPKVALKKILLLSPNVAQNNTTLEEVGYSITSTVFEQGLPFIQMLFRDYGFSPYSKEHAHRHWGIDFVDAMASHPTNRQVLLQWLACFAPPLDRSPLLAKASEGQFQLVMIQGEDDHLISPQGQEDLDKSYGACSAVKYEKLNNVGHWSMIEEHEVVAKRLRELLGL